jgi:hypothetical protein
MGSRCELGGKQTCAESKTCMRQRCTAPTIPAPLCTLPAMALCLPLRFACPGATDVRRFSAWRCSCCLLSWRFRTRTCMRLILSTSSAENVCLIDDGVRDSIHADPCSAACDFRPLLSSLRLNPPRTRAWIMVAALSIIGSPSECPRSSEMRCSRDMQSMNSLKSSSEIDVSALWDRRWSWFASRKHLTTSVLESICGTSAYARRKVKSSVRSMVLPRPPASLLVCTG